MREELGLRASKFLKPDLDRIIAEVRAHMGDGAFEAEWNAGMTMDTEEAVTCALAAVAPQSQA